ncbi:cobyrinate a,c-diamide synthase [Halocella sp. SP3-1]|uniref:cobyrinate a,c-diamide synthase n=1 Tax=Halocella sp. SP3-1 TaxID=2382161 RepID=UPI000F754234|nr:cobyrinate a,c-diamide synthase [Halocella sp. SP3-1]AZO95921.1 cobyrinate a,c-diamide synthase [Halocella sp. SP3-1]
MNEKRLLIAGTRSGVGKTTISLGIMAALSRRGYQVQPYKVGPDYIDPGFHTLFTGNNSYNLDSYFLGCDGVKELYSNSSAGADISIIEGVMGLFDGKGKTGVSSTAEIARILQTPLVLLIDAQKMAQSAAALIYGYKNYDPGLNLKGVIFNNIASERHYALIKEAVVEKMPELEILGYLPRQKGLELPERHLGLVPIHESGELKFFIKQLIQLIEKQLDLDKLIKLSADCRKIKVNKHRLYSQEREFNVKIGIAYDQAFNFYYQYNLDLLAKLGAELIYFSPMQDKKLPDLDGIYLGGGFPESFLEELAANQDMKDDIREKAQAGMPLYAECGGLMYLSQEIIDFKGNAYQMLGLIPGKVEMQGSLQEMGYVELTTLNSNLILNSNEKARGHVFHYSRLNNLTSGVKKTYRLSDGRLEGYSPTNNLLASYVHLHFASNPGIASNFLRRALLYKK